MDRGMNGLVKRILEARKELTELQAAVQGFGPETSTRRAQIRDKSIYLGGMEEAASLVLSHHDMQILFDDLRKPAKKPDRLPTLPTPEQVRNLSAKKAVQLVRTMNPRCTEQARKGTGAGICDRLLDEHGQCDRAADHIGG